MPYHFPTKILFCSLLCFTLLGFNTIACAQIYKSYDANGNVVFSDTPSKRSKEVEVGKPNLSDSFEAPPPRPAAASPETNPESESQPQAATEPNADSNSADTNNDGRISRREKEEHREEQRRKRREEKKTDEGWYSE